MEHGGLALFFSVVTDAGRLVALEQPGQVLTTPFGTRSGTRIKLQRIRVEPVALPAEDGPHGDDEDLGELLSAEAVEDPYAADGGGRDAAR